MDGCWIGVLGGAEACGAGVGGVGVVSVVFGAKYWLACVCDGRSRRASRFGLVVGALGERFLGLRL